MHEKNTRIIPFNMYKLRVNNRPSLEWTHAVINIKSNIFQKISSYVSTDDKFYMRSWEIDNRKFNINLCDTYNINNSEANSGWFSILTNYNGNLIKTVSVYLQWK